MSVTGTGVKLVVGASYVLGGFAVNIYGIGFLIALFLLYTFFIIFDILSGFVAARQTQKVLSNIFINGFIKKSLIFLFILGILFICIILTSFLETKNAIDFINNSDYCFIYQVGYFFAKYSPHIFIIIFTFGEFISSLENLSVIFAGKKEGKIFNLLSFLTKKVFNSSLDKVKEYSEKKINEKFDNNLKK